MISTMKLCAGKFFELRESSSRRLPWKLTAFSESIRRIRKDRKSRLYSKKQNLNLILIKTGKYR